MRTRVGIGKIVTKNKKLEHSRSTMVSSGIMASMKKKVRMSLLTRMIS